MQGDGAELQLCWFVRFNKVFIYLLVFCLLFFFYASRLLLFLGKKKQQSAAVTSWCSASLSDVLSSRPRAVQPRGASAGAALSVFRKGYRRGAPR